MPVLDMPPNGELACCARKRCVEWHVALEVVHVGPNLVSPVQMEQQVLQRATRVPSRRRAIEPADSAQTLQSRRQSGQRSSQFSRHRHEPEGGPGRLGGGGKEGGAGLDGSIRCDSTHRCQSRNCSS